MVIKHQKKQKKVKKIKLDLNENQKKSEEQKGAIKNIKTLYNSLKKVIKLFNNYSKTASKAKYRLFYGEGLEI